MPKSASPRLEHQRVLHHNHQKDKRVRLRVGGLSRHLISGYKGEGRGEGIGQAIGVDTVHS
jgi:hypothetical protein